MLSLRRRVPETGATEMENQTDAGPSGVVDGPSGIYETEDGQLVIYDERKPDAYVRSDRFVEVER